MQKLGIPETFSHLVRLLLQDAQASISISGRISKPFSIERGVLQGCPLAPYLFLLVAEALNMAVDTRKIQGILLPGGDDRQLVSQ